MSASVRIEFRATDLGYGGRIVVHGADLEVRAGELVGLIGPNAAGKSTMLRAVTGAARVVSGEILLDGVTLERLRPVERARLVGVVPQSVPALPAFSAAEFVGLGRHPHLGRLEHPSAADEMIVERSMELTDTARLADQRVDTLSGGDVQRLTLAQALAQEPGVLLLDEPTSHLDLNHRLQVLDLVRDRADEGLAVLGVFHDLDLAARYSDRIAVVYDGRIVDEGPPAAVLTSGLLRDVFAVRAVVGTDPVTGSVSVTPVLRTGQPPAASRGDVFVLGGSGSSASLIRRLVLAGYTVRAGALNRGDVDQAVAEALGVEHVILAPFDEIDAHAEELVREQVRRSQACVVSDVPFGRANIGNLRAIVGGGCPIVLVGEVSEQRDYCGGEALRMLEALRSSGAASAGTDQDVLAWLAEPGRV